MLYLSEHVSLSSSSLVLNSLLDYADNELQC